MNCCNCKFFKDHYCYRYPPLPLVQTIKSDGDSWEEIGSAWPQVGDIDWCGEWAHKAKETA